MLLICRCNDSGSGSGSTKGLRLNPETLTLDDKYGRPAMSYDIVYPPLTYNTGSYAVIFNGTVNSIKSVGIAVADNPKTATFNMKIYFQADSIPEWNGHTIDQTNSNITITEGSTVTRSTSHSILLNLILETDGTYTISGTGNINGTPIIITSIKARLAGADDSSRK